LHLLCEVGRYINRKVRGDLFKPCSRLSESYGNMPCSIGHTEAPLHFLCGCNPAVIGIHAHIESGTGRMLNLFYGSIGSEYRVNPDACICKDSFKLKHIGAPVKGIIGRPDEVNRCRVPPLGRLHYIKKAQKALLFPR